MPRHCTRTAQAEWQGNLTYVLATGASTASDDKKRNKNLFTGTRKFFSFICRNEMCDVIEVDPVRIEYHKREHL